MSDQLEIKFKDDNKNTKKNRLVQFLSSKEKISLYGAITILLISLIGWTIHHYFSSTEKVPDFGGEYTEGIIGEPLYINPILSQSNEIDASLVNLIFSSLLKYDTKSNLINDIAESYELSEDKKNYTFKIKQGVLWHDDHELKANDIYFTIKLIQDSAFKSPLRGNWEKIEPEVINDYTIKFKLQEPSVAFINNLTFGILPEHVFGEVPADKFIISELNLKPIGSGPFIFSDFKKDENDNIISYQIIANQDYYERIPYIEKINFNFYSDNDELINAYTNKEINGFGLSSSYEALNQFNDRKDTDIKSLKTQRYFAIFLNQTKSVPLASKDVRKALQYGTNKQDIINQVFQGQASEVNSPILENFGTFQSNSEIEKINYNPEEAKKILDESGWKTGDNGIRSKDDEEFSIQIVTTTWIDLQKTAELLKSQWEQLGIKVEIKNASISEFQQNFVRPRDYTSLLFGQEYFGNDPDPYFFWHSSETNDPGKNIALYKNDEVDKILEKSRKTYDTEERQKLYNEFEKLVTEEYPAIFLYSPNYVYITNKKIKGINTESIVKPPFRFSEANKWYVNTKREKKDK